MSKAESYVRDDSKAQVKGSDAMDSLNERLAQDLRAQIRRLGCFPVYSPPWVEMVESLNHLARVSSMESDLPQAKEDATLWETDEAAVRYILEDGKLNLCARAMIEFRANMHSEPDNASKLGFEKAAGDFERGLGSLLRNAWLHIEAIQISDLTALGTHIAEVLQHGLKDDGKRIEEVCSNGTYDEVQEGYVLCYLHQILKDIEAVGEIRIMPSIRAQGVFMNVVRTLLHEKVRAGGLTPDNMAKAVEVLSFIVQTEDYATYRDEYVGGEQAAFNLQHLLLFKSEILAPMLKELPMEKKRTLRPLGDAIDKVKRLNK